MCVYAHVELSWVHSRTFDMSHAGHGGCPFSIAARLHQSKDRPMRWKFAVVQGPVPTLHEMAISRQELFLKRNLDALRSGAGWKQSNSSHSMRIVAFRDISVRWLLERKK